LMDIIPKLIPDPELLSAESRKTFQQILAKA
jgi:hypothetical protein